MKLLALKRHQTKIRLLKCHFHFLQFYESHFLLSKNCQKWAWFGEERADPPRESDAGDVEMEGGKGRGEVLREGVVKDESEERRNGLILPAPLFLQHSIHLIKTKK